MLYAGGALSAVGSGAGLDVPGVAPLGATAAAALGKKILEILRIAAKRNDCWAHARRHEKTHRENGGGCVWSGALRPGLSGGVERRMIAVALPIAATVRGWFRVRLLQRRTGASPTRDHEQLVALDGLRAISIGLVLVTHLVPLGPKELRLNEMTGPMGMSLFFALSGFLIVRTLRADSVAEFVIKRLARILPLAWLYLGVVALLFSLEGPALLASLAFVLNYRTDLVIPVTEHLWSLGVETQFYAFVGVLALLGRNALVLVWPCCFAITALRVHDSAMIAVVTHLRGDEVLAGACLGCVSFGERRSGKLSPFLWALAAASWAATSHPSGAWLQYLRPYASMALLAATLWLRPGGLLSALGSAPLRYVARISYALYIIHPLTAQHGWWNEGSILERYILKRPAGLVLTFATAHLSTAYWEQVWTRAARRWIARLRDRRVSPAAAAGHPVG